LKPETYFLAASAHPVQPDDELCLCFHVTKRKVTNHIRIAKPRRASQLSECFGAGTGCGWCRPYLERLFEQAAAEGLVEADMPNAEDYARMRAQYIRSGGGTPPEGAAPTEDEQDDAG
jgi:NAD(P)H-nitrite reductase large subunit